MDCTDCRIANQESVSWLEIANSAPCPEHMPYVCDECRTAAYDDLGIEDADEQAEACKATGDLLGDHACEFRDDPDSEPCYCECTG